MAKYMIGVTEAGDASVNLQWEKLWKRLMEQSWSRRMSLRTFELQ